MFDGSSYVVPPRPTYAGPCTCVWPAEYARQQERAKIEQDSSAKADVITSPIGVISSALPERMVPGAFQGVHHRMQAAADNADKKVKHEQLDEFGRSPQLSGAHSVSHSPPLGSSSHPAMLSTDSTIAPPDTGYPQRGPGYGEFSEGDSEFGSSSKVPRPAHIQHHNPEREDPKVADNRARTKAQAKGKLATKAKPDPLGRAGKKWFAKSSETKMRELTAYREDVVVVLKSLIPDSTSQIGNRAIVNRGNSLLCPSCMVTLTHYMYYSPTRFEPYLSETSTRAYLTLVDDAIASSHTQNPMEAISHHELERVLRAELAAIEWRLAMKIARFHRKTDILNLFPVKVGEYAELRVNQTPPSHPEGVLKKAGKKVLHTMGFSSGVTGAAHSAKEAASAMPSE